MSTLTSLHARVQRYLVERGRLGFDLRSPTYALRSFARHVRAVGHRGPLTVEVMADWARRDSHGSNDPRTWARRLRTCARSLSGCNSTSRAPRCLTMRSSDACRSGWRRTSTASRRSLICWPPREGLGRRLGCVAASTRRCSV